MPKSDRERLSILARARPEDVVLDPYPHVVIKHALYPDTYAQLAASYPKYKDVVRVSKGEGKTVAPNTRVDIRANMVQREAGGVLTPLWKEFIGRVGTLRWIRWTRYLTQTHTHTLHTLFCSQNTLHLMKPVWSV
jgi:hypothetical protein